MATAILPSVASVGESRRPSNALRTLVRAWRAAKRRFRPIYDRYHDEQPDDYRDAPKDPEWVRFVRQDFYPANNAVRDAGEAVVRAIRERGVKAIVNEGRLYVDIEAGIDDYDGDFVGLAVIPLGDIQGLPILPAACTCGDCPQCDDRAAAERWDSLWGDTTNED